MYVTGTDEQTDRQTDRPKIMLYTPLYEMKYSNYNETVNDFY